MKNPLTIVGGGLAGLALALALRRSGVEVTVHEAGRYPRHRVCGEFMAGLREETLQTLGLAPFLEDAPRHFETSWFENNHAVYRATLPRPAPGISRFALDERLARALTEAGGVLHTQSRISPSNREPGWVRASGKRSSRTSNWVGMKAHFSHLQTDGDLEIHFGRNAYVGISAVEAGWFNVCGLFPKEEMGRLPGGISGFLQICRRCGLEALAGRLASVPFRPDSLCATAAFLPGAVNPPSGHLHIGDRLGMMPPFTGNGMTLALETAAHALPYCLDYAAGTIDWETAVFRTGKEQRRRFIPRLNRARSLHPFIWNPAPRRILTWIGRRHLLPWRTLFALTH